MAKFNAQYYRYFRPFYPGETFHGFKEGLLRRDFVEPFDLVDVGCGTGHSIVSLRRTGLQARMIGIDPDIQMLEQAQDLIESEKIQGVQFDIGSGEATGLAAKSMDAVLVGSAFHWMNGVKAKDEFARILKPSGIVRIFEYQFPKAQSLPQLNEWIRRQFNLYWKALNQTPRGSFLRITDTFRLDDRFELLSQGRPRMTQDLGADEFLGLILSQSRVLCYEETLSEVEKLRFHESTQFTIKKWLGETKHRFDFKLNWIEFGLK
jgi:SAM-dependent methyltransferase